MPLFAPLEEGNDAFFEQLHNEIKSLTNWLKPIDDEDEMRRWVVDEIERIATTYFRNKPISVIVFGSFATGLYLPKSDLDISIIYRSQPPVAILRALERQLEAQKWIIKRSIERIYTARIPLLKFETTFGLKIDLSANNEGGLLAKSYLSTKLMSEKYVGLRELVLLFKFWMEKNRLDVVFQGGMGAYSLILMVVFAIQEFNRKCKIETGRLGRLFTWFCEFYYRHFQNDRFAVDTILECQVRRPPGGTLAYSALGETIFIKDPHDAYSNIARSSYRYQDLKLQLGDIRDYLEAKMGQESYEECKILSDIIAIDKTDRRDRDDVLEDWDDWIDHVRKKEPSIPNTA